MRKLFALGLLFFSLIILFFSCKKTDSIRYGAPPPVDRFFSAPSDAPKEIKAIAQALKKQNDQYSYLSSITKRAGYPRWDKARIANYDKGTLAARGSEQVSGEIVYIPFVKDSDNYVNSLLAVKIDASDTVYRMIYAANYRAFGYDTSDHTKWSARDVFNIFTSFDYTVFGHTKFWVRDTNLFKPERDSSYVIATRVSSTSQSSSARTSIYTVAECTAYTVCTYPGAEPTDGGPGTTPSGGGPLIARMAGCSTYDFCTVYTYGDGGGGTTGTGDGTGGGGGSGWYSGAGSDPCAGSTPVERTARVQVSSPCGGWTPVTTNPVPTSNDPCSDAKVISDAATSLSRNNNFIIAKNNIQTAAADSKEHSITFGKDASGSVTISPMDNGGGTSGTVNTSWPGAFADLHNHPQEVVPSPGDFYDLIPLNQSHNEWKTRFVVTPGGSIYALVVIDLTKATAFKSLHPADQVPGYPPTFPGTVGDDLAEAKSYIKNVMGLNSLIADEMAMAFVLEKYDTGIALLKQGTDGAFKRLRTAQTNSNGTLTYTANNCQ